MNNILLIDDNSNLRKILSGFLTDYGYQVSEAFDGEMGIELLENDNKYKVVITDICMPKKNGNDVARHIRRKSKINRVKIVGITGSIEYAEPELFDHLIPKPFNISDIIGVIHG